MLIGCDRWSRVRCALVLFCLFVEGCGNTAHAPISDKQPVRPEIPTVSSAVRRGPEKPAAPTSAPTVYRVARGDTLYSIAWRFGLDHRALARWNGIRNLNVIYVGQQLSLTPKEGPRDAPRVPKTPTPRVPVTASAKPAPPGAKSPITVASAGAPPAKWRWPAEGQVAKAASSLVGNRALEIRGRRGATIRAAAAGEVVYSGSGLRGYGQLIIIKHNDVFLSAYAHNDKLLVAEGAKVNSGQEIAQMGDSESKDVMLHFEIRRNGKAVEPLEYLPKR